MLLSWSVCPSTDDDTVSTCDVFFLWHRSTLAPMGWRHFSLAPEQEGPSREESSGPARPRQPTRSDWALDMLDSAVRRTGSINKNLLMRIFKDISTGV